jgi:hypothetical protein
MRKSRILLAALVFSLVAASRMHAMTFGEAEFTCPIDGQRFVDEVPMSGSQFGEYLDRRPAGALSSPWLLGKCKTHRFPMFKTEFTPAEKEILRSYVTSAEYRELSEKESDYYLVAKLKQRLGASPEQVATTLLQASWEVDATPRYERYAKETLAALEALIAKPPSEFTRDSIVSYSQIAGELERRLGRFDAARKRFEALSKDAAVQGKPLEALVRQELALIEAKSSGAELVAETPAGEP